jgi:hypothetical protein
MGWALVQVAFAGHFREMVPPQLAMVYRLSNRDAQQAQSLGCLIWRHHGPQGR